MAIRRVVKNGHLKDMCHNDIGLRDQNTWTILGLVASTIGRAHERERERLHAQLAAYNLCISTSIPILEIKSSMICNSC